MADQTSLDSLPLVLSADQAPSPTPIHPPTMDSYGPGSASDNAGSGSGDQTGLPSGDFGGTGDRGGADKLAAKK